MKANNSGNESMLCRSNCGACCIAPSINNPIPNMPNGKPSGVICHNLNTDNYSCTIWQQKNYPAVCSNFKAGTDVCGESREEALRLILEWETATTP